MIRTSAPSEQTLPAIKLPRAERRLAVPLLVALGVMLPISAVVLVALGGGMDDWRHLSQTVLPRSITTTFYLLLLVSAGTVSIGVTSAWLVTSHDFPGRQLLSWALVLPFAIPPYLAAYAFGEFLQFTGPVQGVIRDLFGFQSARDYWFPDIRTTGGAALVMSAVLYPYVYLTTRVVFLMQGRTMGDAARTLGASRSRVLLRVLLPVARPAIAAGLALVLMETLNDIGAVEYLGVRTLTFSIYNTWLNRGSLEGAAQIACVMLVLVFFLLWLEHHARRRQRFNLARATQIKAHPPRIRLTGWRGWLATVATALPVLAGFGIPVWVVGGFAARRSYLFGAPELLSALGNSVLVASLTAIITVLAALLLINAVRLSPMRPTRLLSRLATAGYALPGSILGLGLLFVLGRFDNMVDAFARSAFGYSTGLLLTGGAAAVVYACSVRFLAIAEGTIRSGMDKLPRNIDHAARSLGSTEWQSAQRILLPLLRPAMLTAGILVFVDTIKELSATILLRPFGFPTLATHIYEAASRGAPEEGAAAALLIIASALVPVLLLSRTLLRDEPA